MNIAAQIFLVVMMAFNVFLAFFNYDSPHRWIPAFNAAVAAFMLGSLIVSRAAK